ncbi:DUF3422 family protein [Pseudooceanicola sp. C21-150M6]|uniref:DUF3422 family protein n=1 Tax=Pseudooceanicola sp. C21-150M6 TaxID=3434355 RepID=UPI003D7FE21E
MDTGVPMTTIDHPARAALVDELHARPFPTISVPSTAWIVALRPERRSDRDRKAERAQLDRLIEKACQTPPPPEATHWIGRLGPLTLKWENHTEFVTFLVWGPEEKEVLRLAGDILEDAEGMRIASARFRIMQVDGDELVKEGLVAQHTADSLAAARVIDDQAVVACDFRPDAAGDMHFSVFCRTGFGPGRTGRLIQRLCDIETYRAMAMLGLIRTREMGAELAQAEASLSAGVSRLNDGASDAEETLQHLLDVAAQLERLVARASFRLSATKAYERIVNDRIASLREVRFHGRQTFGEFMSRRFDPAMRTVEATDRRLTGLTERARRAGELLRTRVEVDRSRQNRELLASMDRRSDEALRLQHTVEGLSVVAISYYAVGLVLYLVGPVQEVLPVGKPVLAAVVTPIVVLLTWAALRRIRSRLH